MAEAAAVAANPKNLLTVEGFLRIGAVITSIVAFACVADTPYAANGQHLSKIEFTMAANIIAFIWLVVSLACMACMTVIAFKFPLIRLVNLFADGLLCILTIIGGITSAVFCGEKIGIGSLTGCGDWGSAFGLKNPYRHNIPAASTFSFFTAILLGVLTFISFRNKN